MALAKSWQSSGLYPRAPAGRPQRLRAFARARRHSRLVRVLRVLLPVAGVLAVAAFVVRTQIALPGDLDLTAASMSVTPNSIIMDHPHLTGFVGDRREYSLMADRAIQPLSAPGQVRLETIQASVTAAGHGATRIAADAGDYDHDKSTLQLLGAIAVNSAEGYRLRMSGAHVDFENGTMVSDNRVSIGYAESEITGDRMIVSDGGKVIVIEGRVVTKVLPPKRPADASSISAPVAAPSAAE